MRFAFIGSKHVGLRVLQAAHETIGPAHEFVGIVTPDDRDDTRSVHDELHAYAADHAIPVADNVDADVALVCGWYHLLPVDGTRLYGFHASPLPRYRGQAPVPWQIINGETAVGLTLFRMTEGIDEGPIVAQDSVPLGSEDTVADALAGIGELAVGMTAAHLPAILEGTETVHPQDDSQATYCGIRRPEDGLIDWSWPARRIHDFVRAQTRPYPGAFTVVPSGDLAHVWRTRPDPRSWIAVPGTVCQVDADELVVGCGDGALRVLEMEGPELRVGSRLGVTREGSSIEPRHHAS